VPRSGTALARDRYLKAIARMIRLRASVTVVSTMIAVNTLLAQTRPSNSTPLASTSAILQWNNGAMQGIRDAKLGAPVVARALEFTCACTTPGPPYDERAIGTQQFVPESQQKVVAKLSSLSRMVNQNCGANWSQNRMGR